MSDNIENLEVGKLERKNKNIAAASMGISLLGSVGGVIYAIQKKKSGWAKVGWWFLGGIITGVPSAIGANIMIRKNQDQIAQFKNPTQIFTSKENQEQAASDACEPQYDSGGAAAFNQCRKDFIKNSMVG